MNDAKCAIAGIDAGHDHPETIDVGELLQRDLPVLHLAPDRERLLFPAINLGFEAGARKLALECVGNLLHQTHVAVVDVGELVQDGLIGVGITPFEGECIPSRCRSRTRWWRLVRRIRARRRPARHHHRRRRRQRRSRRGVDGQDPPRPSRMRRRIPRACARPRPRQPIDLRRQPRRLRDVVLHDARRIGKLPLCVGRPPASVACRRRRRGAHAHESRCTVGSRRGVALHRRCLPHRQRRECRALHRRARRTARRTHRFLTRPARRGCGSTSEGNLDAETLATAIGDNAQDDVVVLVARRVSSTTTTRRTCGSSPRAGCRSRPTSQRPVTLPTPPSTVTVTLEPAK